MAVYQQHTLFKVVHFTPDWVKKDLSFDINSIKTKKDCQILHMKYHQEMVDFMKWAEVDPQGMEM